MEWGRRSKREHYMKEKEEVEEAKERKQGRNEMAKGSFSVFSRLIKKKEKINRKENYCNGIYFFLFSLKVGGIFGNQHEKQKLKQEFQPEPFRQRERKSEYNKISWYFLFIFFIRPT